MAHPIYDCLYLALAGELEIPMVTADNHLLAAAARIPRLAARAVAPSPVWPDAGALVRDLARG